MNAYQPRHAKQADPRDLPPAMRGLADKIQIVPGKNSSK